MHRVVSPRHHHTRIGRRHHGSEAATVVNTDPPPVPADSPGSSSTSGRTRFFLLIALLTALTATAVTGVLPDLASMATTLRHAGPVGAIAATSLLVSAMVPRSVVAAAAGLLYGASAGSAYVIVGALMGAVVSFEIGHRLGRDFLRGRPWLATVDRVLERRGVIAVLIVRLIPVAPFGLASYAFGTTAVRRLPFLTATGIGIGPSTVIFANLGANAMRPTSPAFIVSTLAAITLAVVGLVGARMVIRRGFRDEPAE